MSKKEIDAGLVLKFKLGYHNVNLFVHMYCFLHGCSNIENIETSFPFFVILFLSLKYNMLSLIPKKNDARFVLKFSL